jgi:hypothetical protein
MDLLKEALQRLYYKDDKLLPGGKKHTSKWISKEIEEKTFGLGLQMKEPV